MSRASRTAEILAAAGLVPMQLEQERIRAGRDAARSTALASLLPALIDTGAGIAGRVAEADLAERKFAADLKARKARDAAVIEARKAKDAAAAETERKRVEALAAKSAAAMAKANAEAEAARPEMEAKQRAGALTELRSGAAGRSIEALIGTASMDDRLGDLDDDAVRAIQAEEQTKAAKAAAELTLAERKAKAPLGPRGPAPKTPQQLADAADRRTLTQLQIDKARQELSGDKPLAPSEGERKEQNNVDSMTKNIGKLESDLDVVVNDGGFGPGFLSGPARNAISKVLGDKAWTDFASTRDAVNLQIFGTLRSDAPSEGENKAAENLKITDGDTLDSIRSKMTTVRALLDAKRRNPGSRLDTLIAGLRGAPAVDADGDDIESEADELGITLE